MLLKSYLLGTYLIFNQWIYCDIFIGNFLQERRLKIQVDKLSTDKPSTVDTQLVRGGLVQRCSTFLNIRSAKDVCYHHRFN